MKSRSPLRFHWRAAVAPALGAFLAVACRQSVDSADDAASTVTIYYSADEQYARPILDLFEQRTGIDVRPLGDTEATKTTGLAQRLRQEHAQGRPRADVFWSSEVFMTVQLAQEGVLTPIQSETLSQWPARWRDAHHRWYGFAARGRVCVYNTEHVSAESAPTQIIDLCDPRFKNRVVIARPQFGTTRGHFGALLHIWGEDRYRRWLQDLKANGVRLVDGNAAVVQAVATGEAFVGLTDTDDVYAGKRNGWPVDMTLIEHANSDEPGFTAINMTLDGAMVIPNTVARVAGGPNEQAALQLIEFLLSEDVERLLAESDSHNMPVRSSLQEEFPQLRLPSNERTRKLEQYEAIAQRMDEAVAMALEALGG